MYFFFFFLLFLFFFIPVPSSTWSSPYSFFIFPRFPLDFFLLRFLLVHEYKVLFILWNQKSFTILQNTHVCNGELLPGVTTHLLLLFLLLLFLFHHCGFLLGLQPLSVLDLGLIVLLFHLFELHLGLLNQIGIGVDVVCLGSCDGVL